MAHMIEVIFATTLVLYFVATSKISERQMKFARVAIVCLFALASFTTIASAQDRVTVNLAPSMVTITEGEVGHDVNGFVHHAEPVMLNAVVTVQDGLKVRGHVALPAGVTLPVQYVAYDNGRQIMSTDQGGVSLNYRDFSVGLQWHPAKKIAWAYGTIDYEATGYTRSASGFMSVIVNGENVREDASVENSHRTLSFGVGVSHEFAKFGFRAETNIAPFLSSVRNQSNYDNSTGFSQKYASTVSGHGTGILLAGSYYVTNHVGLEASWTRQTFSYQNWFDVDNDIHPQTRWKRYTLGVVTRF